MLLERLKRSLTFLSIIRGLVSLVLVITIVSTIYHGIYPLLPTKIEYDGSFPDNFWENFDKWKSEYLPRHIALFGEHFNMGWVLTFLSRVFFLLLLLNIRGALSKYKPESKKASEELVNKYFDWAIGSLLIAIVFMSRYINEDSIIVIGLGIFAIVASIFVLSYYTTRVKIDGREKKAT